MNLRDKLFRKQETKLTKYYALMIGVLVFLIIALMSGYYIGAINKLNATIKSDKNSLNGSLANIIFDVAKNDSKRNDFSNLRIISNNFVENDLISYLYIKDKKANKVVWSSYSDTGTPTALLKKDTPSYVISIGFPSESPYKSYLDMLLSNTYVLIIAVLIMGLVAAFVMSKIVLKPLNKLLIGANEYAKGNFSHKMDKTEFMEINGLVNAFNNMSDRLKELYSTLEQKVKDRTLQLSEKNAELDQAYKELKGTQAMMVHSEKMRSLGELVAGITHEINNPLNFIYANLIHLNNYSKDLVSIITMYEEIKDVMPPDAVASIEQFKKEIDYEFLKKDLPDLLKSCKDGTERTKNIIIDLKNFSRMEEMVVNDINVHKEIDTILNILHNKYKNKIEVHKNYEEDLPSIESYGGQLNQVFMNILDNAAYAIKDRGDVYITTHKSEDNVIIEFKDNGEGIDQENLKKVFDPFFTTKPVGAGTGLGMSISYKVIKNHNGNIDIESTKNVGTKITITLPIKGLRADVEKESV